MNFFWQIIIDNMSYDCIFSYGYSGVLRMSLSCIHMNTCDHIATELILGLRPANERRRYKVTSSLIGWVQA